MSMVLFADFPLQMHRRRPLNDYLNRRCGKKQLQFISEPLRNNRRRAVSPSARWSGSAAAGTRRRTNRCG